VCDAVGGLSNPIIGVLRRLEVPADDPTMTESTAAPEG